MDANPNQPHITEDVHVDPIHHIDKDKNIIDQESEKTILPEWYKDKFNELNEVFERESVITAGKVREYDDKINELKTMSDKEIEDVHQQFKDAISHTAKKHTHHEN